MTTTPDSEYKPVADKGPWVVSPCGKSLQSDDFTHDVALAISGDFADEMQRVAYAQGLAAMLNDSATALAQRDAEIARLTDLLNRDLEHNIADYAKLADALTKCKQNYRSAVHGRKEMRDGLCHWKDSAERAEAELSAAKELLREAHDQIDGSDHEDIELCCRIRAFLQEKPSVDK